MDFQGNSKKLDEFSPNFHWGIFNIRSGVLNFGSYGDVKYRFRDKSF